MKLNDKKVTNLFTAVVALKNVAEAKKFLRDLLTEPEIIEFSNRWLAAQMLDAGRSYTEIAGRTGLSSTTIARISKWLYKGEGGYKLMLEKFRK